MDIHSRDEYLKVLRERHFTAGIKKEKSRILDDYRHNTGQARKYVIWKIHRADPRGEEGKARRARKFMVARSLLLWLKFGKSLIILVVRDSGPYWRQK